MTIYRPTVAQEMGGDHSINKARWGQNHTVRILESSEGIRLKPSDTLVSNRLHEAQHNDVTAQRWVLTEQDERQGQRHQPYEEQENESKFEKRSE